MTAKDVAAASSRIRAEVEKAGGYVSDANEAGSATSKSATLEVRIPANDVRTVRALLADLGEITSESEKVEDVTEARADLNARLANARAQEKRIVDIMSQRAGTIADVLEAERELARVRETIERLEAQQRTMEGRIALATIKIHLHTPYAEAKKEPWRTPGQSIAGAFDAGLRGAATLAVYVAMALAAASPILVPVALTLGTILTILKRRRRASLEAARSAG